MILAETLRELWIKILWDIKTPLDKNFEKYKMGVFSYKDKGKNIKGIYNISEILVKHKLKGYVIDFIEFDFIDFPIFNIADIYVVMSMILLFAVLIFRYSNEEFDEILGIKQHGRKNNDSN